MGGEGPDDFPEPARLRQLRWLVNTLTATLIVGVIAIVTLLVIRLGPAPPAPRLPAAVRLPAGESAQAVTFGKGWVALVTVDRGGQERIRVLDSQSGGERAMTEIPASAAP
jgi:hypothetical protein